MVEVIVGLGVELDDVGIVIRALAIVEACDLVVVQLLDPLGRSVELVPDGDANVRALHIDSLETIRSILMDCLCPCQLLLELGHVLLQLLLMLCKVLLGGVDGIDDAREEGDGGGFVPLMGLEGGEGGVGR